MTRHSVLLPASCARDNPIVQQPETPGGHIAYRPPLRQPRTPGICMDARLVPLLPGATFSQVSYVIVRSSRLRAALTVRTPAGTVHLTTPLLSVHLVRATGPGPHIALRSSPAVHAVLSGVPPTPGALLLYTDWYRCPRGRGTRIGGQGFSYNGRFVTGRPFDWTDVRGIVIRPGCAHPLGWHAVAGWVNGPVVRINYQNPAVASGREARGRTVRSDHVPRAALISRHPGRLRR